MVSQGTNKAANFVTSTQKIRYRLFSIRPRMLERLRVRRLLCIQLSIRQWYRLASIGYPPIFFLSIWLTRPSFRNPVSHPSTPHLHFLQLAFIHFFLQIHILTFCNNIYHKQL